MSTRINKNESEDQIKEEYEGQKQQLKSVISENSRIFDNKCPENV